MTGRRALLALATAVFVLLQLRISLTPVVPYGWDGAAFIEHVARVDLVQVLSDPNVSGPQATLQAIDGPFPPLLHLLTTPIAALGGQSAEAAARTSPLWLLLLAAALGALGHHLGGRSAGLFSAGALLLTPALQGYSTRYYYDIPMTALLWSAVALAATTWSRRPILGGLASGLLVSAAALIKWTALPLGAILLVATSLLPWPTRRPSDSHLPVTGRRLVGLTLAAGTVGLVTSGYLLLVGPGSSLEVMFGQMWSGESSASTFLDHSQATNRLRFYGIATVSAVFSPLGSIALLAGLAGWLLRGAPALLFVLTSLSGQLGFFCLGVPVTDERFLVTMAPTLCLVAALGLAGLSRQHRRFAAGLSVTAGLLVAGEFHLGLPVLPVPAPGLESSRLLSSEDDSVRTPLSHRGLSLAQSTEGRGWTPLTESRRWDNRKADELWDLVSTARGGRLWIAPGTGGEADPVLGSYWVGFRELREPGEPFEMASGCGEAPQADALISSGDHLHPCAGDASNWMLVGQRSHPETGAPIGLWRRASRSSLKSPH